MRHLIIKRRRSFVGCAMKMKVYIEDPAYGDTMINGVSCSKIGTLKNGEEATFTIEDHEAKVFVIGDKLTRNLFSEFCTIPAGDEDVHLSGCIDHNAMAGNPFRFDGINDAEVQAHRKRTRKYGILVLVAALIVGVVFSVGERLLEDYIENRPKDFSTSGMTITLTKAFEENTNLDFAGAYASSNTLVIAQKEDFSLLEGFEALSVQEYGELAILASPQAGSALLQEEGGIPWFEYSYVNPENETEYNYLTCMYKASDAFWTVQFIAEEENAALLRPDFMEYAATVRFE